MKYLGLSAVLTGALATPGLACDLCSIYSASEASGAAGQGFYAGVAEQFTRFGTLQLDSHRTPANGEYINSSVSQLFVGYNINDQFSLQLNVPVIHRSFGDATMSGTEAGVGDVSLTGNFVAYQRFEDKWTFTWSVLGGVKFPTGNPDRLKQPDDELPNGIGGHDLALGSGSVDGVVGTGVYGRWRRGFVSANMQYSIRSEGSFGHQYANDLTWSGGPGVLLALEDKYTVSFQSVISGENKGKDAFDGAPDGDSAETIVYLGPQLNFTWKSRLSAQIGADVPVSIYNSGMQVVPDYRVHVAVTWRF